MQPPTFQRLITALNINKSLKELCVDCLPDETMLSLLQTKRLCNGVETLGISNELSRLTDGQAQALAELISSNTKLGELYINRKLSATGVDTIANALSSSPSLMSLNIQYALPNHQEYEASHNNLFAALTTNTHLKKLDISMNKFTEASMQHLVQSIEATGSGLEELRFYDHSSRRERTFNGGNPVPIALFVSAKSRLMSLIVGGNGRVRDNDDDEMNVRWVVDWNALSSGLRSNTVLERLEISGTQITKNDTHALCNALSDNTTLKCLKILDCQVGNKEADVFAHHLRDNHSLEVLDLSDNRVDDDKIIIAFAEALQRNRALKVLKLQNLYGNEDLVHSQKAGVALLEALEVNMSIFCLEVNNMDVEEFDSRATYYLRLNQLKRGELLQRLSEGSGRAGWVKALIETRKDLDCSSYLLKLNPGAFFTTSSASELHCRKRKRGD